MVHISETSVDVLSTFVLLNVLAERTATLLDVGKLVLVLQEELAAPIAKRHCNVRDHVLKVLSGPLRAELRVVHDKNLFIAHALQGPFIHFDRSVLVWGHLRL